MRPLSFVFVDWLNLLINTILNSVLFVDYSINQLASSSLSIKSVGRTAWQAWESVAILPCLTKDRLMVHELHQQACRVKIFFLIISFQFYSENTLKSFRIRRVLISIQRLNTKFSLVMLI